MRRSSASPLAPASPCSRTSTSCAWRAGCRHRHLDRARPRHRAHARRLDGDLRRAGPYATGALTAGAHWRSWLPGFAGRASALRVQPPVPLPEGSPRWPSFSCCRRCSTRCSSAANTPLGDWLGERLRRRYRHAGADQFGPLVRFAGRAATCTRLKRQFKGPVVADVLCYLRLYTELALRAKGILMMRENVFEAASTRRRRRSSPRCATSNRASASTGLRAIQPMLHMSHKDLWQLYMLEAG